MALSFKQLESDWAEDRDPELSGIDPVLISRSLDDMTVSFPDISSQADTPGDLIDAKNLIVAYLKDRYSVRIVRTGPDEVRVLLSEPAAARAPELELEPDDEPVYETAVIIGGGR